MSGRRSLAADRTGLAAIEFAVLVPVFLSFILLLIAGAGLAWAQEVLQETAQSTARCMAAEPTTCATTSAIQTYATTRAANDGLTLTSATITPLSNQTCNGVTGMNQVTISMPYQPLSGTLFSGMITLNAVACYHDCMIGPVRVLANAANPCTSGGALC